MFVLIESPKEIIGYSYVIYGIVFVGYDIDVSCFHDPYNNDIRVMFAWQYWSVDFSPPSRTRNDYSLFFTFRIYWSKILSVLIKR